MLVNGVALNKGVYLEEKRKGYQANNAY